MQEAYRPLCSEYSFCCPNWVPPHPDLAGGGTQLGYPPSRVPPARVPPSWTWQGTPPAGPGRVPPLHQLLHGILGNVAKHYGIWVPPRCGQTNKVKLLPSRRTMYAGGNNGSITVADP